MQTLAETASTAATAVKAAGKAAVGDIAGAAVDLLKDKKIRDTITSIILAFALLLSTCLMMIGSSITGVIESVAQDWSENWNENWLEQGITSNGSALYKYTIGAYAALDDTVEDTIFGLFITDHTVDGRDATNKEISNETTVAKNDYQVTIKSIYDQEALTGENGALMTRLNLIKRRVEQRGKQIEIQATGQYALETIGISVAEILINVFQNPILFNGVNLSESSVTIDTTAFQLSDIQALKILAAYSIQHDCNITEIDMFDLMDYCGWYDVGFTTLDTSDLGEESIYKSESTAVFDQEIGGVVSSGQMLNQSVHGLHAPQITKWRGTFAPQWYYEELEQIREHNEAYYRSTPEKRGDNIPWGVRGEDDEINISCFDKLDSFTTYGLIDKLYASGNAHLSITRTEYHGADEFLDEALHKYYSNVIWSSWYDAYGPKDKRTWYLNLVSRSEDNVHSFSFSYGATGHTKAPVTADGQTTTYSYYLENTSSGMTSTAVVCNTANETIVFSGLNPDTEYKAYETKTVTDASDMVISSSSTLVDTFTTLESGRDNEAYQLCLDLEITYTPRSVDTLAKEIIGLWPDTFLKTETGTDGLTYAHGFTGNPNMLLNWTDTYTDFDGTVYELQFERQYENQVKAYQNMVEVLGEILGTSVAGLYEPEASYGNDIIAVANAEYEYYHANNLHEGSRYWGMVEDALGWTYHWNAGWCVAFVYCCANMCGYVGEGECFGPDWVFWVRGAFDAIMNKGIAESHTSRSEDYKPVSGDIIFFGKQTGIGELTHIGLVEGVNEDGSVNVIHGNWGDVVSKDTFRSYQIGTIVSPNDGVMIAAYIHPEYPKTNSSDLTYMSVSGLTASTVNSHYITSGDHNILLSGVTRLRESQLPLFVEALKEDYPNLYTSSLQEALDAGDMTAFQKAWNKIISSGQSMAFRKAQLAITKKHIIQPIINACSTQHQFNWNKSSFRTELIWGLATTTDQTDALINVLGCITENIDSNITDTDLITYLQSDNFLSNILNDNASLLWPDDPQRVQLSWISGINQLINKIQQNAAVQGTTSDEFYYTIPNADPNYQGHSVPNLTASQIAKIKNTLYGEYGTNLGACILIAQSIRDNVDRSPDITYDNFVQSCRYYGGYPERDPSVYETEIVNQAFDYVFVKGGSGVQHKVFVFYSKNGKMQSDDDYQALFLAPLEFVIEVGVARFFCWDA